MQKKIAVIQMRCTLLDVQNNLDKAEQMVKKAAADGAELVCLPEAFNTGYLSTRIPELLAAAETLEGESITRMRALASQLHIWLVAPILCRCENGGVENSAVFLNDRGEIVGVYSKSHPVGDERIHLQRGTAYPVWDTPFGKVGIVICYDVCFPETVRMLALKGAELVLVPSAWRGSHYFKEWWDLNLACRALDNLLYIAAANLCGPSGDEIFAGKSQVCSPIGEVLATCGVEEEHILCSVIEPGRVAKERAFNTVLTDRHPIDYQLLTTDFEGGTDYDD